MTTIGIDIGKDGALALLRDGQVVRAYIMPRDGKVLNISMFGKFLADLVLEAAGDLDLVVIEQQSAVRIPTGFHGPASFKLGYELGCIETMVRTSNLPYMMAVPSVWVKKVLVGIPGKGKGRNITAAGRLFPNFSLIPTQEQGTAGRRTKKSDGLADAVLLAHYGQMYLKGGL